MKDNVAPIITVSNPVNAITGDSIVISATASDSDGTISSVEFFVDDVSVGTDATSPYTVSYKTTVGKHFIKAVATDNFGFPIKTLTNKLGSYTIPYKNEAEKWKLPFGTTTDYNKLFPQAIPITSSEASTTYVTDGIDSYQYNILQPYQLPQITQFGETEQTNLPLQSFTTKQKIADYTSPISTILINKRYKPEDIETFEANPGKNHIYVSNNTSSSIKPSVDSPP